MKKRFMTIDVKAEVWLRTTIETELTDEELQERYNQARYVSEIELDTENYPEWELQNHVDKYSGQDPETIKGKIWIGEK